MSDNQYKTNISNYNNAQSGKWVAFINGYDDIAFKLKNFTTPSYTAGSIALGHKSPYVVTIPGDHIEVGQVSLEFFVDEFFANFVSVVQWIKRNAIADEPIVADIFLYPIDSNNRLVSERAIIFRNCWPLTISELLFDAENAESEMYCNVLMNIFDMDFEGEEKIGKTEF